MDKNKSEVWVKVRGEVTYRKGSKDPWIEMVVTTTDGKEVKLIARRVERHWSEREEVRL